MFPGPRTKGIPLENLNEDDAVILSQIEVMEKKIYVKFFDVVATRVWARPLREDFRISYNDFEILLTDKTI